MTKLKLAVCLVLLLFLCESSLQGVNAAQKTSLLETLTNFETHVEKVNQQKWRDQYQKRARRLMKTAEETHTNNTEQILIQEEDDDTRIVWHNLNYWDTRVPAAICFTILGLSVFLFLTLNLSFGFKSTIRPPPALRDLSQTHQEQSLWFKNFGDGPGEGDTPLYSSILGKRSQNRNVDHTQHDSMFLSLSPMTQLLCVLVTVLLITSTIVLGIIFLGSVNASEFLEMLPTQSKKNSFRTGMMIFSLWLDFFFSIFGFVMIMFVATLKTSVVLFTRRTRLWFRVLFGLMIGLVLGMVLGIVASLRTHHVSATLTFTSVLVGSIMMVLFGLSAFRSDSYDLRAAPHSREEDDFIVECANAGNIGILLEESSMQQLRKLYHLYEHEFLAVIKKDCKKSPTYKEQQDDENQTQENPDKAQELHGPDCFDVDKCLGSLEDLSSATDLPFSSNFDTTRECFTDLARLSNLGVAIIQDADKITARVTFLELLESLDGELFPVIIVSLSLINAVQSFTGLASQCHPLLKPLGEDERFRKLAVCQACASCEYAESGDSCENFDTFPSIPGAFSWTCNVGTPDVDLDAGSECHLICREGLKPINGDSLCNDGAVYGAMWTHVDLYGADDSAVPYCVEPTCPQLVSSLYPECCMTRGFTALACGGCPNLCMASEKRTNVTHTLGTEGEFGVGGTRIHSTTTFVLSPTVCDPNGVTAFLSANPALTISGDVHEGTYQAVSVSIPTNMTVPAGTYRICGGYAPAMIISGFLAEWQKNNTVVSFPEDRQSELYVVDFGQLVVER